MASRKPIYELHKFRITCLKYNGILHTILLKS